MIGCLEEKDVELTILSHGELRREKSLRNLVRVVSDPLLTVNLPTLQGKLASLWVVQ